MSTIAINPEDNNIFTPLDNKFIDNYMAGAHGDYIKVYIYLLRISSSNNKKFETSEVARTLKITESDLIKALKYWTQKGLIKSVIEGEDIKSISISAINDNAGAREDDMRAGYSDDDCKIVKFKKKYDEKLFEKYSSDEEFVVFAKIIGRYFSSNLNVAEINMLINLIEKYDFKYDDLIFIAEQLSSNGINSVKSLESKCLSLVENGIRKLEDIKKYMRDNNETYAAILKKLNPKINTYHISEDNIFTMDKWIYDYDMPFDMIYLACERTVQYLKDKDLGHQINYTNQIISNWHIKGIKTVEKVMATEPKAMKKTKQGKKVFNYEQHNYDFSGAEEQHRRDLEGLIKEWA